MKSSPSACPLPSLWTLPRLQTAVSDPLCQVTAPASAFQLQVMDWEIADSVVSGLWFCFFPDGFVDFSEMRKKRS